MGGALSSILPARVGSDTYYSSVEASLQALAADIDTLEVGREGGWNRGERRTRARAPTFSPSLSLLQARTAARRARVDGATAAIKSYGAAGFVAAAALAAAAVRAPAGALSSAAHAARVAPLFLEPVLVLTLLWLLAAASTAAGARDARALSRARARLRAAVAELKDATRHDRTASLLAQYDPDRKAAAAAAAKAGARPRGRPPSTPPRGVAAPARAPTPAGPAATAAAALAAAGGALLPALDRLAAGVVGDDPTLVAALADARREAAALRAALAAARDAIVALAAENGEMRDRLGRGGGGDGGTPRADATALPPAPPRPPDARSPPAPTPLAAGAGP
jgi:hypothetical protein